jgi:hypothetical protein
MISTFDVVHQFFVGWAIFWENQFVLHKAGIILDWEEYKLNSPNKVYYRSWTLKFNQSLCSNFRDETFAQTDRWTWPSWLWFDFMHFVKIT